MRALCLNVSPFTVIFPKNYTHLIHSYCYCSSPSSPGDNGRFRLRITTTRRRNSRSELFLGDKEEVEAEEREKLSGIGKTSRSMRMSAVDTVEEEEEDDSSMLLSLSVKPDRNMALLDDYEMEELDFVPENPNHRSGLFFSFLCYWITL